MNTPRTSLLITLTGRDRPGVTSRLFAILARYPLSVLDVEQVVIRGRLVLGVLLGCDAPPDSPWRPRSPPARPASPPGPAVGCTSPCSAVRSCPPPSPLSPAGSRPA